MILDLDLWIFLGFGFPIQIQFKNPIFFKIEHMLIPLLHACFLIMIFIVRIRASEIND
jgi:hypothetical protein